MTVNFPVSSAYELWGIVVGFLTVVFIAGGLVERVRKDKYVLKEVHEICLATQTTAVSDIKNSIIEIKSSIVTLAKWAEQAIKEKEPPVVPFILT